MAKITTLADLTPTPDEIPPNPYPLSDKTEKSFTTILKIHGANKHNGTIVPAPLDKDSKYPAKGVLFKADYPPHKRWSMKKFTSWLESGQLEMKEYDFGCLVSGGFAVLDFDCERDWEWFIKEFPTFNPEEYFITQNVSKHNCSCPKDQEEHTYHIWFLKDDMFSEKHKATPCLEGTHIDFLRDAYATGTPCVIKLPNGIGARKWLHKPKDKIIKPLPKIISEYFGDNWRLTKKEKALLDRSFKYIELCEIIPANDVSSQNAEQIIGELKNVGHTFDVVLEIITSYRNNNSFGDRVGVGTTKHTIEQHNAWVRQCYDAHEPRAGTTTIEIMANADKFKKTEIQDKWLNRLGDTFTLKYLTDVKFNCENPDDRNRLVERYYNKFFITTTGEKKPRILQKVFHKDGTLKDMIHIQDKTSFIDACGIKMLFGGEKTAQNSSKWWYENHKASTSFTRCVFKTYGIKPTQSVHTPNEFNVFSGYKMKYVKDYNKPENDHLGDAIEFHIRNVLCWDGKGKGDGKNCCNEPLYDFYRAWLYKLIVLGERTKVGLVHYSRDKGTGKSMFSESLYKYVIGEAYSIQCATFTKTMKDTFSDYFEECVLAVIEELPEFAGKMGEAWDMIKSLTTDDRMTSRKFMTAPDQASVFINLIINTNHWGSISSDWLDRRAQANRINNFYRDKTLYFSKLDNAFSYEGWENYIHRKLIKDFHQFSTVKVMPHSSLMVDTPYRNEIMARGNDSVIYFFQDLFYQIADEDGSFSTLIGKHISISGLFEKFREWKQSLGIDEKFYNTQPSFEKALLNKFEIEIKDLTRKEKVGYKLEQQLNAKSTPKVIKTRLGRTIVFDEKTISQFVNTIKDRTHHSTGDIDEDEVASFNMTNVKYGSSLYPEDGLGI